MIFNAGSGRLGDCLKRPETYSEVSQRRLYEILMRATANPYGLLMRIRRLFLFSVELEVSEWPM